MIPIDKQLKINRLQSYCCISNDKKYQKKQKIIRKSRQLMNHYQGLIQYGNINQIAKQIQKLNKCQLKEQQAQLQVQLQKPQKLINERTKATNQSPINQQDSLISVQQQKLQQKKDESFQLKKQQSMPNPPILFSSFSRHCTLSQKLYQLQSIKSRNHHRTDPIKQKLTSRSYLHHPLFMKKHFQQQKEVISFDDQDRDWGSSFSREFSVEINTQEVLQQNSNQFLLVEVMDWIKFVCLIVKLDKNTYNRIARLLVRVVSINDQIQTIFYYAGACVTLYAKMQSQILLSSCDIKQFPQLPVHSQHKRPQIQSSHPILQMKQLRRAQCEICEMVSFRFQLEDYLIEKSFKVMELWNLYLNANQHTLKIQLRFLKIGTNTHQQRINYFYFVYMLDVLHFLPDFSSAQSMSQHTTNIQFENQSLYLILLSIFVVISFNCGQQISNRQFMSPLMIIVKNFSKKAFHLSQSKLQHLIKIMKKSMQLKHKLYKMLSRVPIEELKNMEKAAKRINHYQVNTYIHNRTMQLRNFGKFYYHQDLQWFL